jgi:hypothetical protein
MPFQKFPEIITAISGAMRFDGSMTRRGKQLNLELCNAGFRPRRSRPEFLNFSGTAKECEVFPLALPAGLMV